MVFELQEEAGSEEFNLRERTLIKAQSQLYSLKEEDSSSLHGYSQLDSPSKLTGKSNMIDRWRQSALQIHQSKSQEKPP